MSGYELNDPKHPTYYDRVVDLWDNRDKTEQMYSKKVPAKCDPEDCAEGHPDCPECGENGKATDF
jgi:hypothetical protein